MLPSPLLVWRLARTGACPRGEGRTRAPDTREPERGRAVPFAAPQEYYDLYNTPGAVTIPAHKTFPPGAPPIAFRDNDGHPDVPSPWLPLPDERIREIRHYYQAAVTLMDAQLGKLVAALDELGLSNNTVLSFTHAESAKLIH